DPPLMRLRLIKTGDRRYHLTWTCHYLLLGGWSGARFIEEVLARYAGIHAARPAAYAYRAYIASLLGRDRGSGSCHRRTQLASHKARTLLADTLVNRIRRPATANGGIG